MKDPAFLFYPGDYLRDTQMLGEKSQVAYDRIMCEHMRNICISKSQLKFLTKRLSEEEKEELSMVLTQVKGGYQITWVKESIEKRRKYSDSRRKNRESNKEHMKNISKTYDSHMENEIENVNEEEKEVKIENVILPFDSEKFEKFWDTWKSYKRDQFKFKYASTTSEQITLKKLCTLSGGDESTACEIIEQSIANGWKGFFEIKQNGQVNKTRLESRANEILSKYN